MLSLDEDAVICDLAETYHILNWRGLPVKLLATLCVGLKGDSRIKMKITGQKIPLDTTIQTLTLDSLNMLRWQISGGKRGKKPASIYAQFTADHNKDIKKFKSGSEFEKYRQMLIERSKNNG